MRSSAMSSLTPTSTVSLTPLAESSYRPRPRDWEYLAVLRDLLTEQELPTQRAIAKRLNVTHQAVQQYQKRPGFNAWVATQLRVGRDDRFEQLYERNWALAMAGSIEHSNWLAKVDGRFKQPETPLTATVAPIQVNIGFGIAGVPSAAPQPPVTIDAHKETP